ncbi:MAG TPA: CHASE domain-containing protein [Polyangiales bacterium]|nr:CHASE domain-containing protein [Polyangiales bacterium]
MTAPRRVSSSGLHAERARAATVRERLDLSSRQVLLLALWSAAALALTALSVFLLQREDEARLLAKARALADERCELLRTTSARSLEVLYSLAGFLSAAPDATREEFAQFVRGALARLPELQALEWVPAVSDTERADYEARARRDGLDSFALTQLVDRKVAPAVPRPLYLPVYYAEPRGSNSQALGLDLLSDPVRRAALEHAQETHAPAASAPVRLAQEQQRDAYGFLVFLPVYGAAGLHGFALAVFRATDLFAPALGANALFEIGVFDGARELLRVRPGEGAREPLTEHLSFAGRDYQLRFAPTVHFLREHATAGTYGYPLFGLLVALSLLAYAARGMSERTQIARANKLLSSEIRIRKHAQEEAAAARAAQSKFLASMSHELRTPLNAIVGYSQLLSRQELDPQRQRHAYATIVESSSHLLGLIDEVLDLSKIEAGTVQLHEVDFNLGSLVSGLSALFTQKCERKGLHLKVEGLGVRPYWVRGDENKLRQVLINLLGNAVKFTREGEVRLRVVPEDGRLVRFEVIDTGPGISERDQERVFGAFVQSTAEGDGAGLGLAISRQLVALMGGELTLQSSPGWGSDFFFTLEFEAPLAVVPSQLEQRYPRVKLAAPLHALVVDDVERNRDLLADVLRAIGCTVRCAASGAEALSLLERERPAIVFMDIVMPELDGIETAHRILAQPSLSECKLVALSASALKGQREEYLRAGFHDFIPKPFRVERINDCLAKLLSVTFVRAAEPRPAPPLAAEQIPEPLRERIRAAAQLYQTTLLRGALRELSALDDRSRALAEQLETHALAYDMQAILDKLDALPTELRS